MLQLPLNVQLDDYARFDNYFTDGNQQLIERLKNLNNHPGDFIFIWGAGESGKTHLAQALCHQFDANNLAAVYLPLDNDQLTPEILSGLSCLDLVCLDNLESIEGDENWEKAIFDLYNNLKIEDKCLVAFSSQAPVQSAIKLADLKSRLTAMEIYKVDALDDLQKCAFFQQRAANRGIDISDDVARFLLSRRSRSVADLVKLLDQIDRSTIALQRKVTIPLLKEIFEI